MKQRLSVWIHRGRAQLLFVVQLAVLLVLRSVADIHVYGGGLLVAYGARVIYPPAGPIAFGLLLLYLGLRKPRQAA